MCGRFTLKTPPDQWGQLLLPHLDLGSSLDDWQPRYNIAPTQPIAAVLSTATDSGLAYSIQKLRWGLVPFWADDIAIGNRMINARAETVAEKPAFRAALAKRRCVIVADGYYEWQTHGKLKQPFWIHRPGQQLFALAGLWESNRKASAQDLLSATIITSSARDAVSAVHDRMPVILAGDSLLAWLDPATSASQAVELFERRECDLQAQAVSTHVNNARHEDPACLNAVNT